MHFLQNSQCDFLVAQSAHCWFWPTSKLVLGKWGKHFALINDSMIGGRNLILVANFYTFKVHPDFIKITCPFFLETTGLCDLFTRLSWPLETTGLWQNWWHYSPVHKCLPKSSFYFTNGKPWIYYPVFHGLKIQNSKFAKLFNICWKHVTFMLFRSSHSQQ